MWCAHSAVFRKPFCFSVLHHLSFNFSTSFAESPPELWEEGLIAILQLGPSVPRSLSLHTVWPRVSALVPICFRGDISDDGSMNLAECHYESLYSLASILAKQSTLCYAICVKAVVFSFPVRSWPVLVSGFWPPSVGRGFHLTEWALNPIRE